MADVDEPLLPPKKPVKVRTWDEIQTTGLLWYINSVLHPRGFAIAVHPGKDGHLAGWSITGDGTEPIIFVTKEVAEAYGIDVPHPIDADSRFAAFEALLEEQRRA